MTFTHIIDRMINSTLQCNLQVFFVEDTEVEYNTAFIYFLKLFL